VVRVNDDDTNPMLAAALDYTKRGWQVIPLHGLRDDGACTCRRPVCTKSVGKHPRHDDWPNQGTTSGADLWAWWDEWPDANIGIITNAASGIWALDVDPDKDGFTSLRQLTDQHGPLPTTRIHATGSGGLHYLFTWPDFDIPTTSGSVGEGIDTRGAGNGQIVAPPSVSGKGPYTVVVDVEPAAAPAWLLDQLRAVLDKRRDAKQIQVVAAEAVDIDTLPQRLRDRLALLDVDDRSSHFHGTVAACRRAGLTQAQAVAALEPWCIAAGKYEGRVAAEVARSWGKVEDAQPEPTRRVEALQALVAPTAAPATEGSLALERDQPAGNTVTADFTPRLAVVDERTFERSDDGNALLLIERFGHLIRFCPERGRWLAWDGCRWQWSPDKGGIVREYGKRVARSLPDDDSGAVRHKKHSLSASGTTNMLLQAQTDSRIAVSIDELDAQPWELNTPAGIIDLRTGEILPCDPAKLHTRVTACAPDPDADPAAWDEFLATTFGDPILTGYLQRLVGYSAVGVVGPHVLPFCYGSGGNGKGVFLETVTQILGDYATTAPSRFLMAQTYAGHETEIARLAGARMVLCSEVNEDDRFDEAKVKQLTGGDTLTARFMRQDHFTFKATHQLWLMGNSQPAVKSGGRSFWRRVRLIPFLHEVPEEKAIDDLQGILVRDHGPAILAWVARGASEYHSGGLREPDSVKAATAQYAKDQDTVGRFVEEMCHLGGGPVVKIRVSLVRTAYEQWCVAGGDLPVSAKRLTTELRSRYGIESDRTTKDRFYVGMTLLADDPDPSCDPSSGGGGGWADR
jgi:P4 family phage/plasmid primase-like protien